MAVRTMQLKAWQAATETTKADLAKLIGWSPGGAADQAGVSRQYIHQLIREGKLEAIQVKEGRQLVMYMIPDESLRAWMKSRHARDA